MFSNLLFYNDKKVGSESEEEKNELRKNLLCSIENDFYTTKKNIEENKIAKEDYSKMSLNVSVYKLATENLLMHKKLNLLEKEINELKKIIKDLK